MEYAKEPFNFKLFVLKMLGKWQQFALCTLVGALLFGGIYYLYKVVYAPAREYEAKATYYIEYAKDPELGNAATYFNEYTLNSWVLEDVFVEQVQEILGREIRAEEISSYLAVTLPSDVRVMQLAVVTAEPELTMELLKAYDVAFQSFAERQREINHMTLQGISEEATQIKADIRTQRAFVLGGVLGLVLGGLYIMLKYLLDDGIYVPETLTKRHGLKALGADCSEELAANVNYAVRSCKRVAVTSIGDSPALPQVQEKLTEISVDIEWVLVPSMLQCPEAGEVLRGCDGCILVVTAGKDQSAAIDRVLSYYAQQDVKVIGAVLWNTEEILMKRYER
jgi:capsular polysaccharide biosynthesis protein